MVKNYFKIALRNMMKDKFYTFINVLGLTIGITGCLFVVLYVNNELSYDKFHREYENIYNVGLTGKIAEQEINVSSTSPVLSTAMANEIPGIEEVLRVNPTGRPVFRYGEKAFAEKRVLYVDSNFFSFFNFPLLKGDADKVLVEPNSVVLIEETAKKYFGDEDPIGKILEIGNEKKAYKVTGIAIKSPSNSHLQLNALLSMSSLYSEYPKEYWTAWTSNSLLTYVRKNPNTTVESVNEELEKLVWKNVAPMLAQFLGTDFQEFLDNGGKYSYWIFPITDIRLYSDLEGYPEPTGDITYIYIFVAVGLFLVIIACINFMNLSTAKSSGRAKEVGLRKTLGSLRSQMIGQFLTESLIYSFIATLISLALVYLLLPGFNQLAGVELTVDPMFTPLFMIVLLSVMTVVGFLAGSYPAFYLTGFKVVDVLKGKGRSSMKSGGIRSTLVVFQFFISIGLIICTGVVFQQLQYVRDKNLGFDKDNIIVVNHTSRLGTNRQAFKNALKGQPEIIETSFSNNYFPGVNNTTVFKTTGNEQDYLMGLYYADWDHAEAMGFEMAEGRFFDRDFPSDSTGIVINQAAANQFGWDNIENKELLYYGDTEGGERLKVVGMVKDFNFESLKMDVRPVAIRLTKESNSLMVRYAGNSSETLEILEKAWKEYGEAEPFEYMFMDQEYDALFRAEQRLGQLFTVLSGLAIFVACIGLFGLASFMAEQRAKEIGIRKAMGATLANLTGLLSGEFIKLIIIAFVLAVGPSWYLMDLWLEDFAYRIELNWVLFVLAGVISFLIAWLTVSWQAIKAARANPVDSIRYE